MAMTHERLAVSSGLHTILTNYRVSGSPNVQNPQPTTSLLVFHSIYFAFTICTYQNARLQHCCAIRSPCLLDHPKLAALKKRE